MNQSPLSIISIVGSMVFVGLGNGLLFTYVPFVLGSRDVEPWFAGAAVTAVALGGLLGCIVAGPLIRRVGHARLFPSSLAMVIIAALLIAFAFNPPVWILARGLYGFASNVNFILAQSWINHAASNAWHGKAMSFFYMAYVLSFGTGSFIFGQLPADGNIPPLVTVLLSTIALLPIGFTRLPNPPAPAALSLLRSVPLAWRISPAGVAGVMTAGGISMAVQGFTPIYATAQKVAQSDIGLLVLLMQTGLIFVQYPMGILSDRIDRRMVMLITTGLIIALGAVASFAGVANFWLFCLIYALWAGAIETVYSLANAHANDKADVEQYVAVSSAMLFVWSIGATLVPILITALTPVFGPQTFIYAIMLAALGLALFVAARLRSSARPPAAPSQPFK